MACFHPLRGAFLHTKADNGKRQVKVFKAAETGNTYVYQSRCNPEVLSVVIIKWMSVHGDS